MFFFGLSLLLLGVLDKQFLLSACFMQHGFFLALAFAVHSLLIKSV
jgi:hypothetical protein